MISAQNTVTGSSDEKERDSEKIIKLINRLKESESKKDARIEEFIKLNPETKKTYHKNGKVNVIFDIVNNVPVYISNENRAAGIATKTNSLYPGGSLGLDLEGEGMTIGVWEVGGYPLVNHVEFLEDSGVSRITTPDTSSLNPEESFHATHVNGTIGAKGENSSAKGMAPKSTILAYNSSGETFETVNAFTNNDMLVSNHSYGVYIYDDDNEQQVDDWYMGSYTNGAKNWDDIHHEVPKYLKVTSAGNSGNDNYSNGLGYGYDKLTSDKNSKNSLIVASAQVNFNFLQTQVTSMRISSFSSQGPTDDGRIKPDITGRGESVYSASNGGPNDYGNSQGTSMSCPNVAGSLLLLQEHYNNLNDKFMWSSTLRGLACHTATDDAEDPSIINGGVYLGPDPFWGWGLLNAELAAQTIINEQSNTAIIEENTLLSGAIYSFTVNVSDADKLMVTLCWTDPSGPLQNNILNSTMPVLVNDLDIRITDNSNNEYLPWRLDLSALPYAIKGDNIVDNIEINNLKKEVINNKKIFEIVEQFIKTKKLILYGGYALNLILPINKKIYRDYTCADFDCYSYSAKIDAILLAKKLKKMKYKLIKVKLAKHENTYKLYVGTLNVLDITQLDKKIFDIFLKIHNYEKHNDLLIHYEDSFNIIPLYLMKRNMHYELARPEGSYYRWEKIFYRSNILDNVYFTKKLNQLRSNCKLNINDNTYLKIPNEWNNCINQLLFYIKKHNCPIIDNYAIKLINNITDKAIFADLDNGLTGMLHYRELSYQEQNQDLTKFKKGQKIKVKIGRVANSKINPST